MIESDIRGEVYNLLERNWYWPLTQMDTSVCPQCHTLIRPPRGRPDILVLSPWGQSIVVEVKRFQKGKKSFPFSDIEPGQRRWLDMWTKDQGKAYLALGTVSGKAGSKTNPRYLWVVPWDCWLVLESMVKLYQNSLPLCHQRAKLKEMRRQKLGAVYGLQPWALEWDSGTWHFPPYHPLETMVERDLTEWRKEWHDERSSES